MVCVTLALVQKTIEKIHNKLVIKKREFLFLKNKRKKKKNSKCLGQKNKQPNFKLIQKDKMKSFLFLRKKVRYNYRKKLKQFFFFFLLIYI